MAPTPGRHNPNSSIGKLRWLNAGVDVFPSIYLLYSACKGVRKGLGLYPLERDILQKLYYLRKGD